MAIGVDFLKIHYSPLGSEGLASVISDLSSGMDGCLDDMSSAEGADVRVRARAGTRMKMRYASFTFFIKNI